jgi:hypothetical protein
LTRPPSFPPTQAFYVTIDLPPGSSALHPPEGRFFCGKPVGHTGFHQGKNEVGQVLTWLMWREV